MTRYITLAEYYWLAEQVTGVDALSLVNASRIALADSALHAPMAAFGDKEFYPDFFDKAAVLACRCLESSLARREQTSGMGNAFDVH